MASKIDNIKIPVLSKNFNQEDADRLIGNYIAEIKQSSNCPEGTDIVDFFPLVQRALRTKEEYDQVPEGKRLLLLEDDPPEPLDTEAITWTVISRTPGQYDQGAAGKGKIREVVPHMRTMINHPDHPSEKLIAMGKLYSNWIQFNVYARESKVALNRLLWFEKTMDSFRWFFRLNGYEVIEDSVLKKEKVIIDNLTLIKYPVIYFVKSEDVYHITTQELKKILVTTDVSNY
jgi:hypothetical protein